jgi:hypothetical protein
LSYEDYLLSNNFKDNNCIFINITPIQKKQNSIITFRYSPYFFMFPYFRKAVLEKELAGKS